MVKTENQPGLKETLIAGNEVLLPSVPVPEVTAAVALSSGSWWGSRLSEVKEVPP